MSLELNEFQQEIKQKLSSVQKIICISAITDKKIISAFCVSGVYYSPPQSTVQINNLFSLALFSPGIHNGAEKKLTNNYM